MKTRQDTQQDNISTQVAVILTKVNYIEQEVKDIRSRLEKEYVTHDEFEPYKNSLKELRDFFIKILLVILGAIVMAVLGLIIVTPK